MNSNKLKDIFLLLNKHFPNVKTSLDFSNEFEAYVSILLSVQTKDKMVNKVTKKLFMHYKTYKDIANTNIKTLSKYINSIGLYTHKSNYLICGSQMIIDHYNSKLPRKLDDLIKLPGIGRKVANVILSEYFHINEGIAIDTHNIRISQRIGISKSKDPKMIEQLIMRDLSRKHWNKYSLLIIELGRNICSAGNPKCSICPISYYCDYFQKL